jgi:protein SCO1/2
VNTKLIIIVCLLTLATGLGVYLGGRAGNQPGTRIEGLLWPDPITIEPFAVLDQHGASFTESSLQGKWSLLFFGYTHCPDICPLTLSVIKQVYEQLAQAGMAEDVQVLFATVDPERDTLGKLSGYLAYFNPDFIGLGGTVEQIQNLTQRLGAISMRGETDKAGGYLVDHTAAVFLIDPKGRLLSIYSPPHTSAAMLSRLANIRSFISENER